MLITRSQHLSTLSGSSITASGLQWQTQPTPQTVEAGSNVSFTCSALSKKINSYEWEHDGLILPQGGRATYKNDGATLELSQIKFEDRGDYRCVATRSSGKVLGKSQNAALNVKGTYDTTLLSRDFGRSFLVPELLASCHFLRFLAACFHLFLRGGTK